MSGRRDFANARCGIDGQAYALRSTGNCRQCHCFAGTFRPEWIYGSRARGEERADSDLDVFVELVALEDMLSRELGLKVQLGTHDALHPLMKPAIERDAVRVL